MSSLSGVFWDRIFTVTGFRRQDVATLRDMESMSEQRELGETIELLDLSWSDREAIDALRAQLKAYLPTLRQIKADARQRATSRVNVRDFVEDSRHAAIKKRELSSRVTCEGVVRAFKRLNLDNAGISAITRDERFEELEELRVSKNAITAIDFLPPKLHIFCAAANQIRQVQLREPHTNAVFLELAANDLDSLAFLECFPALAVLDVSFNRLANIDDIITMLDAHPHVIDADLRGNPVCFVEGYRRRVCSAVPTLQVLDGAPVAESDRQPPSRDDPSIPGFENHATCTVALTGIRDLHLAMATGDGDEPTPAAVAAAAAKAGAGGKGKADAKGGAGKGPAKGKGGDEQPSPTSAGNGAVTRRLRLASEVWSGGRLECEDVEGAFAATQDGADAALDAGPKGAKGGKQDKKAAVAAVPAPTAAALDAHRGSVSDPPLDGKPIVKAAWSIGGAEEVPLARLLSAPFVLRLFAEDTTAPPQQAAPSPSDRRESLAPAPPSAAPTPAPGEIRETIAIGRACFDFSSLACAVVLSPTPGSDPVVLRAAGSVALEVDSVALAQRRYRISKLRRQLEALEVTVRAAEADLAESVRSPTPLVGSEAESAAAQSSNPGKPTPKKAAAPAAKPSGKAPQTVVVNDAVLKLQEAVAAAKAAVDEKNNALAIENRALAAHMACSGVVLSATCTITCRGPDTVKPPEPEADALASTVMAAGGAAAKKSGKK